MKTMTIVVAALFCAIAADGAVCKMQSCKEPAIERSHYCERHTCATKGCYGGVKIGGIPNWAQGNKKNFEDGDSEIPSRIVWRHCPKHCCARTMPRLSNDFVSSLLKGKSEDELLEIMACGGERLFKGKYCLRHSCAVSNCSSAVLEDWSDRVKKTKDARPEKSDLTTCEFCPRHLSMKDNNKFEREGVTKETCSENYERKLAEKQARIEKQKADLEKQRAAMEEKRKAAAEKKKAAQAD